MGGSCLSPASLRAFVSEIEKQALVGKAMSFAAKRPLLAAGVGLGTYAGYKGFKKGYKNTAQYGNLPGGPPNQVTTSF